MTEAVSKRQLQPLELLQLLQRIKKEYRTRNAELR